MRKIVTAARMRAIDAHTIGKTGIPGVVLMEHAGFGCTESIIDLLGTASGKKITVVCGKGNNGGDGFVIARWLVKYGADVRVFLLGLKKDVKGDARVNLDVLYNMNIPPVCVRKAGDITGLGSCDLVVDAILGTGLSSAPRGLSKEVIDRINRCKTPVFAVDGPSGLDMDTGQAPGSCIRAVRTATMACPKPGLLVPPGLEYAGDTGVVDIGVPDGVLDRFETGMDLVGRHDAALLLPDRPADAHKGTCGSVAVIGGSAGMTGAVALTASATLKTGAGKTVAGVPGGVQPVVAKKVTEVMTKGLPDTAAKSISGRAAAEARKLAARGDVTILGPGISLEPGTVGFVQDMAASLKGKLVIDADALTALAGKRGLVKNIKAEAVLTPHMGEFARLAGVTVKEVLADRITLLRSYAKRNRVITVLKGHPTITADTDGHLYFNTSGNAGMATAGAGDVLAGVIGGLIAQGVKPVDAAVAGVYVHGLAGDTAAVKKGRMGMIAGDILKNVPAALKSLRES